MKPSRYGDDWLEFLLVVVAALAALALVIWI